jgi:hypothetical protein
MSPRRTAPSTTTTLVALALGLCAAVPARADITAQARISHFGYRLVDLRPGDGIAPGITFSVLPPGRFGGSEITSSFAYADLRLDPDGITTLRGSDSVRDSFNIFKPMSTNTAMPGLGTAGRMSGSLAARSFEFLASGHFDPAGVDGANWQGTAFRTDTNPAVFGEGGGVNSFRLAPFTRVVWTGQAAIALRSTDDLGASTKHATTGAVTVELRAEDRSLLGQFSHVESLAQSGPGQRRYNAPLRLVLSNDSADSRLAFIAATSVASGSILSTAGAIAPVPEPGTWALMLCGLGLVGAAARLTPAVAARRLRRTPPSPARRATPPAGA